MKVEIVKLTSEIGARHLVHRNDFFEELHEEITKMRQSNNTWKIKRRNRKKTRLLNSLAKKGLH